MTTKVKGLLKGLRYISQIFDEKEEEIQIGHPTDVKHVAHIGSDDPSANAPSWMTEFKSAQEPSSGTTNTTEKVEEHKNNNSKDSKGSKIRHLIPKSRHHSTDNDSSSSSKHRHTRRHRSSDSTSDGSVHDSSGGSRHRRHRRGSNHGSTDGSESASQELPPTGSKHSHHRRKSKSAEDGSERKHSSRASRRDKGNSLTDIPEIGSGSGAEVK